MSDFARSEERTKCDVVVANHVPVVGQKVVHHLRRSCDRSVLQDKRDDGDLKEILRATLSHAAEQFERSPHSVICGRKGNKRPQLLMQSVGMDNMAPQHVAVPGGPGVVAVDVELKHSALSHVSSDTGKLTPDTERSPRPRR